MKTGGAGGISNSITGRTTAPADPPEEDGKKLFEKCLTSENTPVLSSVECQRRRERGFEGFGQTSLSNQDFLKVGSYLSSLNTNHF